MKALRRALAARACAAAVAAAFSAHALGQASPEQALGNNADAIRSYNQIQAGLERAHRAPLETVWLRAEIIEEMWERSPALSQAFQGCTKAGTPKQGCMVSGRTFWRFTLAPSLNAFAPGLSAQAFRASPETDAAPAAGGVYLVANAGAIGQRGGAVLLAAGATAQLIDTAFPSVLVEVSAPGNEPLLLGNLAASDIARALALLARQPASASADVASLGNGGRVTLHRGRAWPVQLAAVARNPVPPSAPRLDDWSGGELPVLVTPVPEQPIQVAAAEPRLDDWSGGELSIALAMSEPRLDDWTGGELPTLVAEAPAQPIRVAASEPRLDDWSSATASVEQPVLAAVAAKPIVVAVTSAPARTASADIARMRAEVEAEVQRERDRLAQMLQNRAGRRASFGT